MKKKKAHRVLRHTFFFFALHRGGEAAFYGVSKGDTSSFN